MRRPCAFTVVAVLAIALAGTACGGSGGNTATSGTSAAPRPVIDPGDGGRYAPKLDPADFVDGVSNPYFPLPAGATWTYEGKEAGSTERVEVRVLPERHQVLGISAVAVRDTVTVDGRLAEDTYDWYAQDRAGTVWYLGESTKEYDHGKVSSTAGSWEAGVGGAYPGIVMKAAPEVGNAYRQEYWQGKAEDLAKVVRRGVTERVPAGEYRTLIAIEEWNPLKPKVVEEKYYVAGVGPVLEIVKRGGAGRVELIRSSLIG
jgi:hypothetical protein